jgi:molybdopterin synthase catalytic subunit
MQVTIRFFATLRERAGVAELTRSFPGGATVEQIWHSLVAEMPGLAGCGGAVAFAVNQQYVAADYRPAERDELACIPPVSGGSEAPWVGVVELSAQPIDVAALEAAVADPGAGATVTFVGTTRRENAGRRVLRLEYEAYEAMALSEMRKLAAEAGARFPITRIAIRHRLGLVNVGEASVAIAVSAPHRSAAFAACRFAIDRLKETVPIWKKEHFAGGEVWVGAQDSRPPPLKPPS